MASDDVQRFRDYVRRVDGEAWADEIGDLRIATAIGDAKTLLRLSGGTRGWLGAVHGELKREREAGSRGD